MQKFRVSVLGVKSLFGKTSSLLLKQSPNIYNLRLYDENDVTAAQDLSYINTSCKVEAFLGKSRLDEALDDTDIVVINDDHLSTPQTSFDVMAPKLQNYAQAIARSSPNAIIVIAASPVNMLVPVLSEFLTEKGCYDCNKILGATVDNMRANCLLASYVNFDPQKVCLPVIGGDSKDTIVPLFSQAKPFFNIPEEAMKKLIEEIKQGYYVISDLKGCSEALNKAYSITKFINSVISGLRGNKNVMNFAFTRTTLVDGTEYFSLPVLLGRFGVQQRYGIPKLLPFESDLLNEALFSLNKDIESAKMFCKSRETAIECCNRNIANKLIQSEELQQCVNVDPNSKEICKKKVMKVLDKIRNPILDKTGAFDDSLFENEPSCIKFRKASIDPLSAVRSCTSLPFFKSDIPIINNNSSPLQKIKSSVSIPDQLIEKDPNYSKFVSLVEKIAERTTEKMLKKKEKQAHKGVDSYLKKNSLDKLETISSKEDKSNNKALHIVEDNITSSINNNQIKSGYSESKNINTFSNSNKEDTAHKSMLVKDTTEDVITIPSCKQQKDVGLKNRIIGTHSLQGKSYQCRYIINNVKPKAKRALDFLMKNVKEANKPDIKQFGKENLDYSDEPQVSKIQHNYDINHEKFANIVNKENISVRSAFQRISKEGNKKYFNERYKDSKFALEIKSHSDSSQELYPEINKDIFTRNVEFFGLQPDSIKNNREVEFNKPSEPENHDINNLNKLLPSNEATIKVLQNNYKTSPVVLEDKKTDEQEKNSFAASNSNPLSCELTGVQRDISKVSDLPAISKRDLMPTDVQRSNPNCSTRIPAVKQLNSDMKKGEDSNLNPVLKTNAFWKNKSGEEQENNSKALSLATKEVQIVSQLKKNAEDSFPFKITNTNKLPDKLQRFSSLKNSTSIEQLKTVLKDSILEKNRSPSKLKSDSLRGSKSKVNFKNSTLKNKKYLIPRMNKFHNKPKKSTLIPTENKTLLPPTKDIRTYSSPQISKINNLLTAGNTLNDSPTAVTTNEINLHPIKTGNSKLNNKFELEGRNDAAVGSTMRSTEIKEDNKLQKPQSTVSNFKSVREENNLKVVHNIDLEGKDLETLKKKDNHLTNVSARQQCSTTIACNENIKPNDINTQDGISGNDLSNILQILDKEIFSYNCFERKAEGVDSDVKYIKEEMCNNEKTSDRNSLDPKGKYETKNIESKLPISNISRECEKISICTTKHVVMQNKKQNEKEKKKDQMVLFQTKDKRKPLVQEVLKQETLIVPNKHARNNDKKKARNQKCTVKNVSNDKIQGSKRIATPSPKLITCNKKIQNRCNCIMNNKKTSKKLTDALSVIVNRKNDIKQKDNSVENHNFKPLSSNRGMIHVLTNRLGRSLDKINKNEQSIRVKDKNGIITKGTNSISHNSNKAEENALNTRNKKPRVVKSPNKKTIARDEKRLSKDENMKLEFIHNSVLSSLFPPHNYNFYHNPDGSIKRSSNPKDDLQLHVNSSVLSKLSRISNTRGFPKTPTQLKRLSKISYPNAPFSTCALDGRKSHSCSKEQCSSNDASCTVSKLKPAYRLSQKRSINNILQQNLNKINSSLSKSHELFESKRHIQTVNRVTKKQPAAVNKSILKPCEFLNQKFQPITSKNKVNKFHYKFNKTNDLIGEESLISSNFKHKTFTQNDRKCKNEGFVKSSDLNGINKTFRRKTLNESEILESGTCSEHLKRRKASISSPLSTTFHGNCGTCLNLFRIINMADSFSQFTGKTSNETSNREKFSSIRSVHEHLFCAKK